MITCVLHNSSAPPDLPQLTSPHSLMPHLIHVCPAGTLSDMRYDIYHATIDSEPCGMATQLFYIRPRWGAGSLQPSSCA
jgi:hypothetical protein